MRKWIGSLIPDSFLWRLSFLNFIIVASAIVLSGLAVYNTACFLVDAMGTLNDPQQSQFNATLFHYLLIFLGLTIVGGSLLHFYLTRKMIKPVRQLIASAEQLKTGVYPDPVTNASKGEVGELIDQFNGLVTQLQARDVHRQTFVSDLSHELRTPLTNLNGYLQSLERGDIAGSQELFESLHQESKRLTAMLEQLEQLKEWDDAASAAYVTHTAIDMAELIRQSTAMFEWRQEQENIPLTVSADSCRLSVHVAGMQQVISNLLENAFQYYTGDGPITVQGVLQESVYCVSVSGPSRAISDDEAARLFKRFYRPDDPRTRETGGSGLGLAIAADIIENHGGEIGLQSEGPSNSFWFTCPLK
ncbi:sensor histidine kinase [Lentibacillus kimchii]|uniref:histidine kinase n=1 Tax=Lentibacillus kimchii TaxID=1542911 RepID=A0ABW2UPY7_9BACI